MSDVQCQTSNIRRLFSEVCLMSHMWYLMSYVCCQTSDIGQQTSDVWYLMSYVRGLMFVVWSLISDICCRTSNIRHLISGVWCLLSDVWCQTSVVWCETSDVCCLMSHVWYLMSYVCCLMFVHQATNIRRLMSDICCLTSESCGETGLWLGWPRDKKPGKPRPQGQHGLAWPQLARAKIEKAKQKHKCRDV